MVLGKLPVPGRPTIWIIVGQGPTTLAVGAGGGCLDIFTLIYPFFPLSPSLWETARYRLKYCLKGPLNPKQPTNQSIVLVHVLDCFKTFNHAAKRRWVRTECRLQRDSNIHVTLWHADDSCSSIITIKYLSIMAKIRKKDETIRV